MGNSQGEGNMPHLGNGRMVYTFVKIHSAVHLDLSFMNKNVSKSIVFKNL